MAFTIITDNGLAAFAAAQAAETFVDLTQLAVGDGNGAEINPVSTMTALVNETWRGGLNRIYVSDTNANWLVIEALIPAAAGGWDIREIGVFAADGTMIGVGPYPLTSKPAPGSGSEKDIYIRMILEVTNAASVTQQIDPTLVYLTQWHLDEHAALTAPHSATSAATANRLMLRDSSGRAKVAAPSAADDIARKDTVDAHAALTAPHSATSAATANRLMLRDSSGRAKVAAPSAADDIARKDTVDAEATLRSTADSTHAALTAPHSATSEATANRLMLRDSSGRAKVAAPSAADDIARKDTVDNHDNTRPHIALGETSATSYRGDWGKIAYDHSQSDHMTSTDVFSAIAGASYGAVGTYGFFRVLGSAFYTAGQTIAGSSLYPANSYGGYRTAPQPSGTWLLLGSIGGSYLGGTDASWSYRCSLFVRVV